MSVGALLQTRPGAERYSMDGVNHTLALYWNIRSRSRR